MVGYDSLQCMQLQCGQTEASPGRAASFSEHVKLGKPHHKKKRKSSDNIAGGGGIPPVTSFWGWRGVSDDFLSLAFGGKLSHKLDYF